NGLMNVALRRALGKFQVAGELVTHRRHSKGSKRVNQTLRISKELRALLRAARRQQDFSPNFGSFVIEMLCSSLEQLEVEARIYQEFARAGRYVPLFRRWRASKTAGTAAEFEEELRKHLSNNPSSLDGLGDAF